MKYKILTYAGWYVDETMLAKGLYQTGMPRLHPEDMTIEKLKQAKVETYSKVAMSAYGNTIVENIEKCELETFELSKVSQN